MNRKITLLGGFFASVITLSGLQAAPVSAAEERMVTSEGYHYTAQPGDSYSQMARKAVQTYGINNNTRLSLSQIIFAETKITEAAGSPLLNVGEKVTIKKDTVRSWVDQAKRLSAESKAAWDWYVPHVDFNTNNVGE